MLVCAPADTIPVFPAVVHRCGVCDGQVWVSQMVAHRVDSGWLEVLCLRCAAAEVGVEQPRFGLLPEQVPALASLDMLGVVRQLLADLNGDVAGGGPRS